MFFFGGRVPDQVGFGKIRIRLDPDPIGSDTVFAEVDAESDSYPEWLRSSVVGMDPHWFC